MRGYAGRGLPARKVALVTGGDSGIGRAVCVAFAKEGADVALAYLCEDADAEHTAGLVRDEHRRCLLLRGDLAEATHCADIVRRTVEELGQLGVLVDNVATTQQPVDGVLGHQGCRPRVDVLARAGADGPWDPGEPCGAGPGVDAVYHAELVFDQGTRLAARPSDAPALAVRDGIPISVNEAILDEVGQPTVEILLHGRTPTSHRSSRCASSGSSSTRCHPRTSPTRIAPGGTHPVAPHTCRNVCETGECVRATGAPGS